MSTSVHDRMKLMHIYFSGIGGSGHSSLALVAKQAGYIVSGSDKQDSSYIDYLKAHGVTEITIGQDGSGIAAIHAKQPIDWLVYSEAVKIEQPNNAEFLFCAEHGIRMSARDELLNAILAERQMPLLAIAGTHGKTTTTAQAIWAFAKLEKATSHIIPAKLSFADSGTYNPQSEIFIYEADEFARNFLAYHPRLSLITGIDWDHPDIYPTREDYYDAFRQFINQSTHTIIWREDAERIGISASSAVTILDPSDAALQPFTLVGSVNRHNAALVAAGLAELYNTDAAVAHAILNEFPGVSRRFEKLADNLYSDYAHTAPKIRGALQTAEETAPGRVVAVYEGLHNTRQHFMKADLVHLFDNVKQLLIVPSYLAREDESLTLLSPADLRDLLSPDAQTRTTSSALNETLWHDIQQHQAAGDLVLIISAGGGGSLDEWVRAKLAAQ